MTAGKRLANGQPRTDLLAAGCLLMATLLLAPSAFADTVSTKQRQVTKLGEGIYEIRHQDAPNGNSQGNTTVIIGDRAVFVVDSCYLPSSAREDIAQIRSLTGKPVRYLLNTHWHNDHVSGNKAYADAFPGLAIVAHTETKKDMDLLIPGVFERAPKNLATQLNAYKSGHDVDGRALTNDEKKEVPGLLVGIKSVQGDLDKLAYEPPSLTFDRELSFDIGNREVRVKYLGRGHTTGDAIVYLPKERILITGDLLVQPIPYAYGGYPSQWLQTLKTLAQLDADAIVPGHGSVLYDKEYLYLVHDLLESVVSQVDARLRTLGPAEFHSLKEIDGAVDLSSFRPKFAGSDKDDGEAFDDMATHLIKLTFNEAVLR